MKWYIGQLVVAVETHQQGCFKRGDIFIIRGLKESICKCKNVLIDIGYKDEAIMYCPICDMDDEESEFLYFKESCFAPIDTQAITQLLEEVKVSVA